MAKVLVTGANGFIGAHLAERLVARGDQVTCLVRKTSQVDRLRWLDARRCYGDVTDPGNLPALVAGFQIVYHLAGRNQAFRRERFLQVNHQGARNVARACAEQSTPPVVVWVSSLAAAGPASNGRLRTEAEPPVQVSHYGRSKRAGEQAAEEFADRAPITIVRPPMVFGEADWQALAIFKPVARFGIHVVPGLGRDRFSLIHVADLVNLMILAAERGTRLKPAGKRQTSSEGYYFAACGEHPTYSELGRMIGTALGIRRVLVLPSPPVATWIVGAAAEAISRGYRRPFSFNLDKAREARAGSWLCSPQRAVDELGFSVAAPLTERLRQTARWYRENGWL
ncbi:MAG: NAD-dependent epimerase/dehydratase family protein [Planctomycetota bacterium]|jgi:nucleoside-diphosphate-sugar epimerase